MGNKTILFVANYLGLGGTERTMRVLIEEAVRAGYNVHIGSLSLNGERYGEFNAFGQGVFCIGDDIDNFKRYCQLHRVNILHWHSLPFSGLLRGRAERILTVCRELGIRIIHTSPFSLDYGNLESLIDQTVFVSQNSLLKFAWKKRVKTLDKTKYTYIYNPIDISSFSQYLPSLGEKEKLREKYGIPKNAFLLIKNCRPDIWKWDGAIIECLNKLGDSLPDLRIAIQSPPMSIRKRILRSRFRDRILILEHTKDDEKSSHLYKIGDLCVHTSRIGESFGISMIEAMYFGIPVLSMDTDFMRCTLHDRDNSQGEIIIEGKTGYVFDELASLYKKLQDLYSKIGERLYGTDEIRATVIERFEPQYIFSQYEDTYMGRSEGYYDIQAMLAIYKNRGLSESTPHIIFENLNALFTRIVYV